MADALFDVVGRVILIAGGARGLGESLARGLAERGATVVVADRLVEEAEEVAASLPGRGHAAQFIDLMDERSIEGVTGYARQSLGRLDVVINSAGVAAIGPALDLSKEDFENTIAINLTGAFLLSRHAARLMVGQGEGRIIHLASVSSHVVNPQYSAYSPSKAALSQLTRVLALEWAGYAITVNAIGPAMTQTPLTERQLLADEEHRSAALAQIPMGRFGMPEDLLGVTLLLASSAGRFITGQTIFVDGGRTLV